MVFLLLIKNVQIDPTGVITVFWPFFIQSPAWGRFPQCCSGHRLMLCPWDSLTCRLGSSTGHWPGMRKVLSSISSTIKEKHVQNWISSRGSQALGGWDLRCLCLQNVKGYLKERGVCMRGKGILGTHGEGILGTQRSFIGGNPRPRHWEVILHLSPVLLKRDDARTI